MQPRPRRGYAVEPSAQRRDSSRFLSLVLQDRDRAPAPSRLEIDLPRPRREDRVVAAEAGSLAGPEPGSTLADDDLAARNLLPREHLDPKHVRVGFPPVAAGPESFLMSHRHPPFSRRGCFLPGVFPRFFPLRGCFSLPAVFSHAV